MEKCAPDPHTYFKQDAANDGPKRGGRQRTVPHETKSATQGTFVYLADVDAHYERARAAGAEIVHPPRDESYGRTYTVRDIDGHPWFFTRFPAER